MKCIERQLVWWLISAIFKGTEEDGFIDRRECDGDIVTQLDAANEYVLHNIYISSEIELEI